MIQFNCPNCAKSFTVDSKYSGKDARCSQCKEIIKIPSQNPPISKRDFANELQMPPCLDEKTGSVQNRYAEHLKERQEQEKKWGNETERKRFWLFDIFLYPINTAGLIMLLIFAGIPVFIKLNLLLLGYLGRFNPVAAFLSIVLNVLGWGVIFLIGLYKYWYIGQCIRDSAEGEIRVPNGFGDTPGPWELIHAIKNVTVCVLIAFAPAISYGFKIGFCSSFLNLLFGSCVKNTQPFYNPNFYLLLGFGIFIFPMAIASVFIQDSVFGINPFLIIKSICKTFCTYIFIVLAFGGFFIIYFSLIFLGLYVCRKYLQYIIAFKIIWTCRSLLMIYLAVIFAHVLGRFYYKNSEKLNWL